MVHLRDEISKIKGIGEKSALLYQKAGIFNVQDLLLNYPRSFDKLEELSVISDCLDTGKVLLELTITSGPVIIRGKTMQITLFKASDNTGEVELAFFRMPYIAKVLKKGSVHIIRGRIKSQDNGKKRIDQPQLMSRDEYLSLKGRMIPVYRQIKGVSIKAVQKAVFNAKDALEELSDPMPREILQDYGLLSLKEAMSGMHFPKDESHLAECRNRLVFEEFFLFMLNVRLLKKKQEDGRNDAPFIETAYTGRLIESLPFELTNAQKKAWQEVLSDITGTNYMNRLIQGDVGSGKTIIAVLAMVTAAANGKQSALMAPTEVLARQHFETIREMSDRYKLPLSPVLLTGSLSASEKKEVRRMISDGSCNLIVGTHALIQEATEFHNLALIVTDEQHRFGVGQRAALMEKGRDVHTLTMSATPIPRTLALMLYGDMDLTIMDELPKMRKPIKNCVVGDSYRRSINQFIIKTVSEGNQAFVICPLVEESEALDANDVVTYTERLKEDLPETVRIAYLHGKMKPKEKNEIMQHFSDHEIDVLISTTVIEVGIDVPGATLIVVENADRFGLSTLHQLRGRVGRNDKQSYCVFVDSKGSEKSKERLNVLLNSNDGFFIAEEDLRLRGPGELLGERQSGGLEFEIADIYADAAILKKASECVSGVLSDRIKLSSDELSKLSSYLTKKYENVIL